MEELIKAAITLIVGGILGGFVKTYFDFNKDVVSSIWDRRFEEYKKLWEISAILPKWPKDDSISYNKLYNCCEKLKNWYFNDGGILLSRKSTNKYISPQTELFKIAKKGQTTKLLTMNMNL